MVDATPFLPGLSPVQGKAVVARFDGGRLSSEGGLLALREIERRLGLADRLAGCLRDPRMPEKVVHRLRMATTRTRCAPTRCSSWRSIVCPRARNCARNRPFRGWKTCLTGGRCCASGRRWSSSIATRFLAARPIGSIGPSRGVSLSSTKFRQTHWCRQNAFSAAAIRIASKSWSTQPTSCRRTRHPFQRQQNCR
jgi:hypothetical protein